MFIVICLCLVSIGRIGHVMTHSLHMRWMPLAIVRKCGIGLKWPAILIKNTIFRRIISFIALYNFKRINIFSVVENEKQKKRRKRRNKRQRERTMGSDGRAVHWWKRWDQKTIGKVALLISVNVTEPRITGVVARKLGSVAEQIVNPTVEGTTCTADTICRWFKIKQKINKKKISTTVKESR